MNEQWKDIEGYEGLYQVSNLGRVWSVKRKERGRTFGGKLHSIRTDRRGRCSIQLSREGKQEYMSLPRLVATYFVENPDPQTMTEVNHKDEDPSNNRADNLEWCSHGYNCRYGTRISRIKEAQNMAVLQYTLDGQFVAEYASMHIAATAIGKDAGHICNCCQGNRKWAYGYFWRYKDDALYQQAARRISRKTEDGRRKRAAAFTEKAWNVVQLDLQGNPVAVHASTKMAAQAVGCSRCYIINCCNGKLGSVRGFRFVYEKDYKK